MKTVLPESVPEEVDKELKAHSSLVRGLLHRRGIKTKKEAEVFLSPEYEVGLNDPFSMLNMEKAVDRILKAIGNKEHIVVYGDYDCDGIPASAILHDFFKKIGANFSNYIPHRHNEGYGLSVSAVESLVERDTKLIISVDSGITDVSPVAKANELGMEVIITDHHLPQEVLPNAYAILNPKQEDDTYPCKDLCGAGIAYKLVQALIERGDFDIPKGWEKWLLDLVGLATIADMVPLVDENRILARYGLVVMQKTRRVGLQHLFRAARINQQNISEDDVGFMIAPRVNAASRMDEPMQAFHMLTTTDEVEAGVLAKSLESINRKRKTAVARIAREVKKKVDDEDLISGVLFMGNPHWKPSLVGLVANTLAEEFERPVFLWGRDGQGIIKGSCRSGGKVNLVDLMTEANGVFQAFGGHAEAGGFEVCEDKVHEAQAVLSATYLKFNKKDIKDKEQEVDGELLFKNINSTLFKDIQKLAPFGVGNPKPLFLFKNVAPVDVSFFGKNKDHIRLIFKDDKVTIEVISFFVKNNPEFFKIEENIKFSFTGVIEKDVYRGGLRVRIVEVLT